MDKICRHGINKYFILIGVIFLCLLSCVFIGCGNRAGAPQNKESGVYAVYQASNTDTENFDAKMEGTRTALVSLLADKGYTKATVVRVGLDRIRINMPDVYDSGMILEIIGEPTSVKFVLDNTGETVITGEDVVSADSYYDAQGGNGYVVRLKLNSEGRRKFGEATQNNIGQTMSIYLGDSSTPISSPSINSAITNGEAIITGGFTAESAAELAGQIMSGTFDIQLTLLECNTY